jgi:hypothetical protein
MHVCKENMVPHYAPDGFVHFAKFRLDSIVLKRILTAYPQVGIGTMYANDMSTAVPLTGIIELAGLPVWALNCEKQGHVYLWLKEADHYNTIMKAVEEKEEALTANTQHKLYRLGNGATWYLDQDAHALKTRENVVGMDMYIDTISQDIVNYKEHMQYLKSIGESRSLNYLLYGEPGTGKTSTVLLIACLHGLPVYVVDKNCRNKVVLTPPGKGLRILVFEDFDRYLTGLSENQKVEQSGHMADILNNLDGLNSGEGVIRFFTGNDCNIIFQNKALLNRMAGSFQFSMPTADMLDTRLRTLLGERITTCSEHDLQALVKSVQGKITFRPFVSFVIRHMFQDNSVQHMLSHLDQISELPT